MTAALSCNTENNERTFQHTVVPPGLALGGSSLQFSLITFTDRGRQAGGGRGRDSLSSSQLAQLQAALWIECCQATFECCLQGLFCWQIIFFLVVRHYLCLLLNYKLSLPWNALLVRNTQTDTHSLTVCPVCSIWHFSLILVDLEPLLFTTGSQITHLSLVTGIKYHAVVMAQWVFDGRLFPGDLTVLGLIDGSAGLRWVFSPARSSMKDALRKGL